MERARRGRLRKVGKWLLRVLVALAVLIAMGTLGLEHFSLAGNSMGGGVACHYALAHPDKLDRLILVDAYVNPSRRRRHDDGLTARLGEIHTPTLIVWGRLDRWILPPNGERLAREIPGAKLVMLDGLGHVPMEEDPARSVAPVMGFLR